MFELICICVDDSLPNFDVNAWIKKGEVYRTTQNTSAVDLVSHEAAFIWSDLKGNKIIPNEALKCRHIKVKRFNKIFEICLN